MPSHVNWLSFFYLSSYELTKIHTIAIRTPLDKQQITLLNETQHVQIYNERFIASKGSQKQGQ